jgi:hypothetical protein
LLGKMRGNGEGRWGSRRAPMGVTPGLWMCGESGEMGVGRFQYTEKKRRTVWGRKL